MRKLKVGYDFDGVICDTLPAFERHFWVKHNWMIANGIGRKFNFPVPKHVEKNMNREIAEAIHNYQEYMNPHAFAFQAMQRITKETGYIPTIITARNPMNAREGEEWMQRRYPGDFYFVGVGTHNEKVEACKELGITHYADDRFKNVTELAPILVKVYLINRSWNAGRHHNTANVSRINNLMDMYDDIFK